MCMCMVYVCTHSINFSCCWQILLVCKDQYRHALQLLVIQEATKFLSCLIKAFCICAVNDVNLLEDAVQQW